MSDPTTFESTCFMVQIGDGQFYAGEDRDWTEHPSFGKKYSKLKVADAVASDLRERHTGRHIRPVKVVQRFRVEST